MKPSSTPSLQISSYALLLALVTLLIFLGIDINSARAGQTTSRSAALSNGQTPPNPPATVNPTCQPDTGWQWTSGPAQPEIASHAQQGLARSGILASVIATSFGETDSCGRFVQFAVDFEVVLPGNNQIQRPAQKEYANQIASLITPFAKPRLGNVRVGFALNNSVLVSGETAMALVSRFWGHGTAPRKAQR
jgi:hypothetical protein